MTRHNLCTNPAAKNDNTGWGGGSTPSRSTGLTGFPDRTTGLTYTSGTFLAGPTVAISAGQTVTLSIYARSNNFNTNSGTIYAQWSGGGSSTAGYTLTAGVVKRVSITATAPGGTTSVQIILDGQNFASSSYDVTECLYEVSGSLDTYFDGDTASASWDGADGNSASTLSSVVSGDVTDTITATLTATGTNSAVGSATETTTATLTAAGANSAVGGATETTTATITAAGTNSAVGGATETTTAGITAAGTNSAVGGAQATTVTAGITVAALVGSVATLTPTTLTITADATVTRAAGAARTGVTGWDLYSTLALQAQYQDYYKSQPPVACPNDGEPLRLGPSTTPGVWYCPFDGWKYPDDYDPEVHGGM